MKLIYVAGLYRGFTKERIDLNIQAAMHAGVLLAERGYMPVIPHKNTEKMELLTAKCDDRFWIDGTMELMSRCDGVLMVQGWKDSMGAVGENHKAQELGIPVFLHVELVNI